MKKFIKIALSIGAILVVGAVVIKIAKEESKKIKEEENKKDKKLEKLGLSNKEKTEEEFDNEVDKDNFVKVLYYCIEFGEPLKMIWNRDIFRVMSEYKNGKSLRNGILDNENVIHVMQSENRKGEEMLDFYFEIPEITFNEKHYSKDRRNNYPEIGDYIRTFKDAAIYMSDNIIRFTPKPIWELVGYYIVSYKVKDKDGKFIEERQKQIRIPKRDFEKFANEGHDGLFEFVKHRYSAILEEKLCEPIYVEISDPSINEGDETYDFKLKTLVLMFKVSFPIAKEKGTNVIGINIETALKCIKYLTEDLEVKKRRNGKSVKYNHVMFQSRDYDHPKIKEFDFLKYYTVEPFDENDPEFYKRKIKSKDLEYE